MYGKYLFYIYIFLFVYVHFLLNTLLPSDVDKEILCCFVDVEDFIPEQTEAGRALQSQLPERQCCCIAIQRRVAQDKPD